MRGFVCQWNDQPVPHYYPPPSPASPRPEDYRPGLVAEFLQRHLTFSSGLPAASTRTSTSSGAGPLLIPAIHSDHYGIRWRGYLKLPKAGKYTITSRVVTAPGSPRRQGHQGNWRPKSSGVLYATCCTEAAGYHAFQIEFVHRALPAYCHVSWGQDKGFPEKTIGPECFFHDAKQAPVAERAAQPIAGESPSATRSPSVNVNNLPPSLQDSPRW